MGESRVEWIVERVNEEGREWGVVFCVVECRVWGVVWKGYEVKGVDGAGGYLNELIIERINSCWKGELKLPDNNSNE